MFVRLRGVQMPFFSNFSKKRFSSKNVRFFVAICFVFCNSARFFTIKSKYNHWLRVWLLTVFLPAKILLLSNVLQKPGCIFYFCFVADFIFDCPHLRDRFSFCNKSMAKNLATFCQSFWLLQAPIETPLRKK